MLSTLYLQLLFQYDIQTSSAISGSMARRILNPTYSLFKWTGFFRFQLQLLFGFPHGQLFPRLPTDVSPAMMWGGCIGIRLSVCTSVHDPSRPQRSAYSSWWILSYQAQMTTSIRGCQTQWSLISMYIFNVNQPWLCNNTVKIWHTFLSPLCSTYNSWWILFIFGTNDH